MALSQKRSAGLHSYFNVSLEWHSSGFFRKREIKKEISLSSQWVVVVTPFLICLFENEGTEEPCSLVQQSSPVLPCDSAVEVVSATEATAAIVSAASIVVIVILRAAVSIAHVVAAFGHRSANTGAPRDPRFTSTSPRLLSASQQYLIKFLPSLTN